VFHIDNDKKLNNQTGRQALNIDKKLKITAVNIYKKLKITALNLDNKLKITEFILWIIFSLI